ncbi:uncharacterized protein LOC142350625 isoform X1 [Convolutriloba macropyga]|uniref:uncharacterized protein LOC142350625 isoform X1 n=1 Tax=Convolutriloba macropyga TaxID=536237 RepID=UPI003F527787
MTVEYSPLLILLLLPHCSGYDRSYSGSIHSHRNQLLSGVRRMPAPKYRDIPEMSDLPEMSMPDMSMPDVEKSPCPTSSVEEFCTCTTEAVECCKNSVTQECLGEHASTAETTDTCIQEAETYSQCSQGERQFIISHILTAMCIIIPFIATS